ncbi:hypothetical protein Slin15195_G102200 [Septoria linicola]|uniref:Uncharacterized protein n=1 Tax=Septoria linicola TaxID=215465 RepID=A0A9Q9B474_9PEZI|nr:hypothetical protein Slin14017_G065200 [Septoria linicola]USW56901.1 hypothetical protein Slin15195_G102200 [Septoria linicola]
MAPPSADLGHCLPVFECYHSDPANAHTFKPGEGTTTFFDLPRELRDMVYDLATLDIEVFPMSKTRSHHVGHPNRFNAMNAGLLLTSKQARLEVLEQKVYFTNTIFTFDDCQILRKMRSELISASHLQKHNRYGAEQEWLEASSMKMAYDLRRDLFEEFGDTIGDLQVRAQCFELEEGTQRLKMHWGWNAWTVAKQASRAHYERPGCIC